MLIEDYDNALDFEISDIAKYAKQIKASQDKDFVTKVRNYASATGFDDAKLEEIVGEQLLKSGNTLGLAESCTGGYISHKITIP